MVLLLTRTIFTYIMTLAKLVEVTLTVHRKSLKTAKVLLDSFYHLQYFFMQLFMHNKKATSI